MSLVCPSVGRFFCWLGFVAWVCRSVCLQGYIFWAANKNFLSPTPVSKIFPVFADFFCVFLSAHPSYLLLRLYYSFSFTAILTSGGTRTTFFRSPLVHSNVNILLYNYINVLFFSFFLFPLFFL